MGRDAPVEFGLGIHFGEMTRILVLTEQDETNIDPIVWTKEGNRGRLKIQPLVVKIKN